jgi:competence protein ComFC
MFKKLKNLIIESVFPSHCVWCEKIGFFVCNECLAGILKIKDQTCPFCNTISSQGRLCKRCKNKRNLNGVISFGYFKDKCLKEIIHAYKYEDLFALKTFLAEQLLNLIKTEELNFDCLTYVPLSKKRQAKRGYNQSQLIAIELGKLFGKDVYSTLIKTKETKTQVGLSRKNRISNLSEAFRIRNPEIIKGKRIIIIDDVITTGATLEECAKLLKEKGASQVWGLTIAKE